MRSTKPVPLAAPLSRARNGADGGFRLPIYTDARDQSKVSWSNGPQTPTSRVFPTTIGPVRSPLYVSQLVPFGSLVAKVGQAIAVREEAG